MFFLKNDKSVYYWEKSTACCATNSLLRLHLNILFGGTSVPQIPKGDAWLCGIDNISISCQATSLIVPEEAGQQAWTAGISSATARLRNEEKN